MHAQLNCQARHTSHCQHVTLHTSHVIRHTPHIPLSDARGGGDMRGIAVILPTGQKSVPFAVWLG